MLISIIQFRVLGKGWKYHIFSNYKNLANLREDCYFNLTA